MSSDRPSPLSRARALLERVVDTVRGTRPERRVDTDNAIQSAPTTPDGQTNPLADGAFEGLRLEDGALVWRLADASRARAEALLGGPGTPALRIVRVEWVEDLAVRTEQRSVTNEGVHALSPLVEGANEVCAVGLLAGQRFVALHHLRR